MPRKTTILIVILAAITGILIFLAVKSDNSQITTTQPSSTPTQVLVQPYAMLSFDMPAIDVSKLSAIQTFDVIIDTNSKPVAGAQVELSYDPKVITNARIVPAVNPFFGPRQSVLITAVDQTQGRISYAAGIAPDDTEKSGRGSIVRLTLTINKQAAVENTTVNFLTKSAVTTLSSQGSVLKSSQPLQIILAAPTISR